MKYLREVLITATAAVKRFPLVWISAFFASTALSLMIGDEVSEERQTQLALLAQTCALGVPLFFALSLFTEYLKFVYRWFVLCAGVLLLLGVYFYLRGPVYGFNKGELSLEFLGCFLAFHLLVSFLPVQKHLNSPIFWHFNKTLFLRFAITIFYSSVLYSGLAGALLALDQLLGFEIKPIYYGRLWMYMSGLGSVWIFLTYIPKKLSETVDSVYPRGLQVFAQYVLLPLVLLYLLILYVYGAKILYLGTLPVGWVSNLILAFSVLGMLALLLLHPLAESSTQKWIHRFTRGFYIVLIPLLVLLFTAAITRIQTYGFTELRYALLCLAIWLGGMTLMMIITRNRFIWFIPLTLFFTVVVVFFIPGFNLHSVARNSQKDRLIQILKSQNMWDRGIKKPAMDLDDSTSTEILEISKYLMSTHGITGLEPKVVIPMEMRNSRRNWETQELLVGEMYNWGVNSVRFNQIYGNMGESTVAITDTVNSKLKNQDPPDIFIKNNTPYFGFYKFPSYGFLPKGNWNGFMDFDYDEGNTSTETESSLAKIDFENTNGRITILVKTTGQQKDKYLVDSLIKNQISVLTNPKPKAITDYNFKNSSPGKIYTLYGKSSAMQIFSIKYHWNRGTKQYEMVKLNGRFWLH
jgi:hypothetical protein